MRVLAGDGDRAADVLLAVVTKVFLAERDAPMLGVEEAKQQVHDRGLARPAGTQERNPSPGFQPQADTVEGRSLLGPIARAYVLEFQPIADFRRQLEVNLIGQVAVTQAFLPLIRRGKGRIVNIGSIGGHLVLPLHGAYSASKFGMEAVSDALRLELRQWHVPVSLIDPGATQTAIFGKTLAEIDGLDETLGEEAHAVYRAQIAGVRDLVQKTADDAAPVQVLAKTVAKALTAKHPKSRYLAGHGAEAAAVLARTASDGMKDRAVAHEAQLPAPK